MRAVFEFSGFLGLATALHLGLLSNAPETDSEAGGQESHSAIALAASSQDLLERVQDWERLPAIETVAARMSPPALVAPPRMEMPVSGAIAVGMVQPLNMAGLALPSGLPALDQSVPPPPKPQQDVTASRRPKLRPEATSAPDPDPDPVPAKPVPVKPEPAAKAERAPVPEPPTPSKPAKPASKAKPSTAAQAASKPAVAAGSGKAEQTSKPGKSTQKLMARWGGQIRVAIERRKRYPSGTRASGTVKLSVAVHSSGKLASVRVVRSSGDARLDKAAVLAVTKARFRAAPDGLAAGVHRFSLPMSFRP